MTRGPRVVQVAPSGGIPCCCCCRCCECLNFGYVISKHGILRIVEFMLGGLCQSILLGSGMCQDSNKAAFLSFLSTACACQFTTMLLIACYVLSLNTRHLLRQSIFELLFHCVACFLYLSSTSVNVYLIPDLKSLFNAFFSTNPGTNSLYYVGLLAGILHGIDAYTSYSHRKDYR